jgi:hypothetical protein
LSFNLRRPFYGCVLNYFYVHLKIAFETNEFNTQGYSFISNPNLCLFYESIEAISGVLFMTSQMIYANQLGTISTVTSIQGLISATFFGLGE